ncbi:MAG: Rne/Rng family ribonuclease [Phycisphaerales bacterium]
MAEGKSTRSSKSSAQAPHAQMLINYVPGEECRVAIVEDGKLEELHTERFSAASNVGNIYVGKVMNVEPAIQAAFVDFGMGENGFLHVTDLHPRYFPGEEDNATERVGIKTPRRERPPIQAALRRGDEIIVQVLKEGVGTKGPTLTSYLSIPGRFLVMMPFMDKVGVSRKVEDEEERRKMREILDQLELPDGFGFILRTAGMSRTKAELKRDLAYLQRLWKDMDKRLKAGGKPRLLYSESDLLVRALRDILSNDIHEVVIDNDAALKRAARFLKIVAPRTSTRLLHFQEKAPLFHAFGTEQQIALIHAREVPLPSGGRLVIDQTEALVAIDVNSGKSRDSRNSEDNAYQTNIEAVDEICRQLRLRDMGGIVINDLIDMRHASHRKDIQKRFEERLKRDRAKTTVLGISEFGILEMTRQRMRPSHESVHFTDCPTCRGRGMLQKPDSVCADALRDLAAILDVEKVARVEMVVAPRVAGDLLSAKRQLLSRIERTYGKHIDVRVSETVQVDRVGFYAYAADGSDIDLTNLPKPRKPSNLVEWVDPEGGADWSQDVEEEMKAASEPEEPAEAEELDVHPIEVDLPDDGEPLAPPTDPGRRGRRRRGRRGRGGDLPQQQGQPQGQQQGQQQAQPRSQPRRDDPRRDEPRRDDARREENRQDRGPRDHHGRGDRRGGHDHRSDQRGGHRDGGRRAHADDADEWGEPPVREVSPDGDPVAQPQDAGEPPHAETNQPMEGQGSEGGPQGAPVELGPDGQPRKRRRRRRRRRGRGGQGPDGQVNGQPNGQANAGQPANGQPEDAMNQGDPDGPADDAQDGEWDDAPAARQPQAAQPDARTDQDGGAEGEDEGPQAETGAEGNSEGAGEGGGEGGGKRRRRRRRRRGRGGQGGQAGESGGGPAMNTDGAPRQSAPTPQLTLRPPPQRDRAPQPPAPMPEPKPQSRPESRPDPKPEPRPEPKSEAKSEPKPAAPTGLRPPPRSLYGSTRRRVPPGQARGGGDE